MATEENLINFDIIETQKENIQSLPQGRSAKALASTFGATPFSPIPTPGSTRNLNDAIRLEYEKELADIGDSDDPLDIYDRYVKWTLNSYPSAQATPESQLRPLLERATKAFQSSSHYKNDPRYLRLWMHYIRFFSDAPREAFAYLARHSIGEGLALFYEEFASWLEGAGRWAQAEEVYKLGIEREARPAERLLRKFGEFQQRSEQRPAESDGPSSPALPTVRPALVAKVDPFATAPRSQDPQAQRLPSNSTASRSGRQKLAIFSDADAPDSASRAGSGGATKGWESIGTIEERKKENVMGAKPWVGETLKTGKKSGTAPKMMVFKDETIQETSQSTTHAPSVLASQQQTVNPRTGKIERVFVNLEAVYPNPNDLTEEYSFEELRAKHRGWLDRRWQPEELSHDQIKDASQHPEDLTSTVAQESQEEATVDVSGDQTLSELTLGGSLRPRERKSGRSKRKKFVEVKGETQTVQLNLASPTKPKIRRKSTREATMTLHTKAATDDILDIFNQPLRNTNTAMGADTESAGESDYDEEDYTGYTSAGDSTGTEGISAPASEFGDDESTTRSGAVQEHTDPQSTSPWSDFTLSKHRPNIEGFDLHNLTENVETTDHGNEARTGNVVDALDSTEPSIQQDLGESWELVTSTSPGKPEDPHTKMIALPPEDYEAPIHPFRDASQVAQNRLPFMTPIVEQTESSIPSVKPQKDYFTARTPSRKRDPADPALPHIDDLLISSPFQEIVNEAVPKREVSISPVKSLVPKKPVTTNSSRGIIKDQQCNPVDESIRKTILENIEPPLSSLEGYYNHRDIAFNKGSEIRKYIKALTKSKAEKTLTNLSLPPTLHFPGLDSTEYTIKRELGKGAFAPVYLVSTTPSPPSLSSSPSPAPQHLLAIKAEQPPNPWEFYILRLAQTRLLSSPSPTHSRAATSLAHPTAFHQFSDEAYLLESYHDQGTLLDLANLARADAAASGTQGAACDETVAMFFAAELLRALESLHAAAVLHGDVKADNCLVRLDPVADGAWEPGYRADGSGGWASKGLVLIDFGRGVDMRAFEPGVQFIADWKTTKLDCPEMRELRPWTFQADYWGAAGVLHLLLYGKWIEDVQEKAPAAAEGGAEAEGIVGSRMRRYRLKEGFKRYWQAELWAAVFDVLMNSTAWVDDEGSGMLPVTKRVGVVRGMLEEWLEQNAERRGLKSQLRRLEERLRAAKGAK